MRPGLAAIFLLALYASSCNKQEIGTGIGLYTGDNEIGAHFVDTFLINSYSRVEDSVSSSNIGTVNLGFYKDPFFGNTRAGFYTQFEIGSSGVDFGDTLNCDSIVLYLKLGSGDLSYYGPDNKPLRINVQLVSKDADFTKDSKMYTSSSLPVNRQSLLDPDFDNLIQPSFFDTVYLSRNPDFTTLQIPGVIPLKLRKEFGQQILDYNGTEVLESNSNFLEQYKGLYVSIEGEDGKDILFINMADFGTAVMIYYKAGADQEDKEYKFIIDNVSAHFNVYEHAYEESGSIRLLAELQDSTIGNSYFFTQSGGGFETRINFPTLTALRDSQLFIPVNKAELIIPIEPGSTKDYAPPSLLYLFEINEDGKEQTLPDQYHIGGFYDEINMQYSFNIVHFMQDVLNGEDLPELVLKTGSPGSSPNRVLLNGNLADTTMFKPMKLRLYYSSLIN
jgi:hypothetical protein